VFPHRTSWQSRQLAEGAHAKKPPRSSLEGRSGGIVATPCWKDGVAIPLGPARFILCPWLWIYGIIGKSNFCRAARFSEHLSGQIRIGRHIRRIEHTPIKKRLSSSTMAPCCVETAVILVRLPSTLELAPGKGSPVPSKAAIDIGAEHTPGPRGIFCGKAMSRPTHICV
jgi:hypothetical protein